MTNKNLNSALPTGRRQWIGWILVPAILLAVLQIAAMKMAQPWLFPTPVKVAQQLLHPLRGHFASGSLLSNTIISLIRVAIGFVLAAVVGISLGLLMGSMRLFRSILEPIVELLRPLCPIAWLPFAIAVFKLRTLPQLFGFDYTRTILDQMQLGMIFVIFIGGFFPVLTNTLDGVLGVRKNYILLAQTLGASRRQRFIHVLIPATMPMILTGLRQGIGLCWFVIIAAEMMTGANSGIGYLLMFAADNAAMDIVIASMIIIGVIGAALNLLLRALISTFISWHGKEI
ncbi:MAG: ABC transporter permease [Planctomycetota bacterium]